MTRTFEHRQIWRMTPPAFQEAVHLLTAAISRDRGGVDNVIGIAEGGVAPAQVLARRLGARARALPARHNADDLVYRQATGNVTVNIDTFRLGLGRRRLGGVVLIVDDICGSGATLQKVRNVLAPVLEPTATVITATLCVNTGARSLPDYSVWTVSDWVSFPWEKRPAEPIRDLPFPEQVACHE